MDDYPILVARWDDKHPSDLVICEHCKREGKWDPARGDPYDQCAECDCGGPIVFKYDEGDKCPNCDALGHYERVLNHCCSRACMLQAEWATTLAARR